MMPTFSPSGDIVVLDRLSPKFVGYELGDVVVARSATNPKQTVCKRILGMVRWEASIGAIDCVLDCSWRVSVSARLWSRDRTWHIRTVYLVCTFLWRLSQAAMKLHTLCGVG